MLFYRRATDASIVIALLAGWITACWLREARGWIGSHSPLSGHHHRRLERLDTARRSPSLGDSIRAVGRRRYTTCGTLRRTATAASSCRTTWAD